MNTRKVYTTSTPTPRSAIQDMHVMAAQTIPLRTQVTMLEQRATIRRLAGEQS
jgi:hypothetical protein